MRVAGLAMACVACGRIDFAPLGNGSGETDGALGASDGAVAPADPCAAPSGTFAAQLQWARTFGGTTTPTDLDMGRAIAFDGAGNVYAGGGYVGTVSFGGPSRSSAGESDGWLASYTADGDYRWDITYGSSMVDQVSSIAQDSSGRIVIGAYAGAPVTLGTTPQTSGFGHRFAAASGASLGELTFGGIIGEVTGSDPLLVSGSIVGTSSVAGASLTSAGLFDAYALALDGDGNRAWLRQLGGTDDDYGNSITPTEGGSVVAGTFQGTVDFGAGPVAVSSGYSSGYVVWHDAQGSFVRARVLTTTDSANVADVATGAGDRVYIVGSVAADIDFGGGTRTIGGVDGFVAAYASDGSWLWDQLLATAGDDTLPTLAIDRSGHVVVGGFSLVGPSFGALTLTSLDGCTGAVRWTRTTPLGGPSANNMTFAVAAGPAGLVAATGAFAGPTDFGDGPRTSNGPDNYVVVYREVAQ